MFNWSIPEQRRPAPTKTRSSGLIWPPRLVDVQKQRIEAVEAREASKSRPQPIEPNNSISEDSKSLPLPTQNGVVSPAIASNTSLTESKDTVDIERRDSPVSTLTDASEDESPQPMAMKKHSQSSLEEQHPVSEERQIASNPSVDEDTRLARDVAATSDVPKIKVQAPSQASDTTNDYPRVNLLEPRGIDSVLANNDRKSPEKPESNVAGESTQPVENRNGGDPDPPQLQKLRKRTMFARKTRNIVAQKALLNMALGRRFAIPTKEGLRRLARGEQVDLELKES